MDRLIVTRRIVPMVPYMLASASAYGRGKQVTETIIPPTPAQQKRGRVGRNEPCPCGSGKKFKKCHWLRGVTPAPIKE